MPTDKTTLTPTQKDAKKARIPLNAVATVVLPTDGNDTGSARLWLQTLLTFFAQNPDCSDAAVKVQLGGYDGYLDGIVVSGTRPKTDAELETELRILKDRKQADTEQKRQQQQERERQERAEYERLKRKYG